MDEPRLILYHFQTSRRALKHFASHTPTYPALTSRLTDVQDSLHAAELSFSSWLQSHGLDDARPLRFAQNLFSIAGWTRIASTLRDIRTHSQDIAHGVDGIVARVLRFCAITTNSNSQPASRQTGSTGDKYDQHLIEACLLEIRASRSRSRTFSHDILHRLNALESILDALYCALTLLERLADSYMLSTHPGRVGNGAQRLNGRATATASAGHRSPDLYSPSFSKRKDAFLLHEACADLETTTGFTPHLGLAVPGIGKRDFVFFLAGPGHSRPRSHPHALEEEKEESLARPPTLHLHPVTLRSDPIDLPTTLSSALESLFPDPVPFRDDGREQMCYIVPSPDTNDSDAFRITPLYPPSSSSSSSSSSKIPDLRLWNPVVASLVPTHHQLQSPSHDKGKGKSSDEQKARPIVAQPLYPHLALPIILTLLRTCIPLLGTPWLDDLNCENLRWCKGAPLSPSRDRNRDRERYMFPPRNDRNDEENKEEEEREKEYLHVALAGPGLRPRTHDDAHDHFVQRAVQRWRHASGNGARSASSRWSASQYRTRTHILSLGVVATSLATGCPVHGLRIANNGDVYIALSGREMDALEVEALVESRGNAGLGRVVRGCLRVFRGEGEGEGEVGLGMVIRGLVEGIGGLEEWWEEGDEGGGWG